MRNICAVVAPVLCALAAPAFAQGFPTSIQPAQGTPWVIMAEAPYTGTLDEACLLMGLGREECDRYRDMRESDQCVTMHVPNGIVLDALTFTPHYGNTARYNVLVELQEPPTREVTVCDLGNGVWAMEFRGCNNHGLVRGAAPQTPSLTCRWVEYDSSPKPEPGLTLSEVYLPGRCGCEEDFYNPGMTIQPTHTHKSRTGKLVCN